VPYWFGFLSGSGYAGDSSYWGVCLKPENLRGQLFCAGGRQTGRRAGRFDFQLELSHHSTPLQFRLGIILLAGGWPEIRCHVEQPIAAAEELTARTVITEQIALNQRL